MILSLSRHMERCGAVPKGSCADELERRIPRLPPELAETQVQTILQSGVAWLREDANREDGNDPNDPSGSRPEHEHAEIDTEIARLHLKVIEGDKPG